MHERPPMASLDIVTSQSPFQNYLGAPAAQLLYHGRIPYRITPGNEKWLGFVLKDQFRFQRVANVKAVVVQTGRAPLINAIATVERSISVQSDERGILASESHCESSSRFLLSLNEDESELDDREKMRRFRISEANKGNVPWNKGRKHSAETLQRIRERTRIAMQDPKVKMKLVNIGHAQSDETRAKIGIGVREGWQRRREKLMVQETCRFEWQNAIAEASRRGYNGEEELHWDSYEILDRQLKEEWLESVEKRKAMPRPKGSKRAPKSLEQRRKISEAISAKWADPEYRSRVCSALSKYHGVTVGTGKRSRIKTSDDTQLKDKVSRKKSSKDEDIKFEAQVLKKVTPKKKKNAGPTYKDPMASTKLEMIKKIREQRSEMETRKREATQRAKSLIAEAEKAAKALEVAALTSPLARASLLETRKLIAEATLSIENIEKGKALIQDGGRSSSCADLSELSSAPFPGSEMSSDSMLVEPGEPHVNGYHQQPSADLLEGSFRLDESITPIAPNVHQPLTVCNNSESFSEVNGRTSPQVTSIGGICDTPDDASLKADGDSGNQKTERFEERGMQVSKMQSSTPLSRTKKKWIRGRFVEVED